MSSKKVLVKDYASLMECRLMSGDMTSALHKADVVVNPVYGSIYGKVIIINLPVEVPLDSLNVYNDIVSRFDTGFGIPIITYDLPEVRKEIDDTDYSLIILNEKLLQSTEYAELIEHNDFLIGIDSTVNDDITAVGYLLLRTKLENLS